MAYLNGQIPLSALTALSTGGHMLAPAAAAFETWRREAAAAGYDMRPTTVGDAYRNLERQISVFQQRYEMRAYPYVGPYNDVRYWKGIRYVRMRGAAAAVPGTSNHGKGVAIDIKNAGPFGGAYHNWMSRTGPRLGFTNTEGRSVNEPWHWVHSGAWVVDNPIGGGGGIITNPDIPGLPDPLEEDLSKEAEEAIFQIRDAIGARGGLNTLAQNSVLGIVRDLQNQTLGANGFKGSIAAKVNGLVTSVADLPDDTATAVWARTVSRSDGQGGVVKVNALQELADAKTNTMRLQAQLDIVIEALKTVSGSQGLASEDVLKAVYEGSYAGASKAVKDGIIVDLNITTPEEKNE